MSGKRIKLSEQIRRAVEESGLSRFRICKATGIDQAAMSRFMNRTRGLQMDNLDALADVLRLDILAGEPVKLPPPLKPGRKPKREGKVKS